MYKSANRISIFKYLRNDGLNFSPRDSNWIQIYRSASGLLEKKAESFLEEPDEQSFSSFVRHRQEQARRSFLVKVKNLDVCPKFLHLFNSFGGIRNVFHYKKKHEYLLIEMSSEKQLEDFMKEAFKVSQQDSSFHHFLVLNEEHSSLKYHSKSEVDELKHLLKQVVGVAEKFSKKLVHSEIYTSKQTLSATINNCYNILKVNDLDIRKRFLMCREIEIICRGFFSNVVAYPFGSSVTGFGITDCDLDIVLLRSENKQDLFLPEYYDNSSNHNYIDNDNNHSNNNNNNVKMEKLRNQLEAITQLMKIFPNRCNNFFFVKNAKVPILKYTHTFTGLDCDLSLHNLHGVAMSQVLYMTGMLDWKIRALVIFLKLWATKTQLVIKSPSVTLSNFSLSLLVVFFLQQIKIVPPWNIFPCNDNQFYLTESELSEIRTAFKEKTESQSTRSVEELLKLFFDYYVDFDFKKWGISLAEGTIIPNRWNHPIYIANPLLVGVNVCKNVNLREVLVMKDLMAKAKYVLSSDNGVVAPKLFGISRKRNNNSSVDFL